MKATVLIQIPFIIPYGTKIILKSKISGKTIPAFFAGYKTYEQNIIEFKEYNLFPLFKAVNKAGKMSTKNVTDFSGGTLAPCSLKEWNLEIECFSKEDSEPGKYSDIVITMVQVATEEMLSLARRHGIEKIDFSKYKDIDVPYTVFENDKEESKYLPILSLIFDQEEKCITVKSSNTDYTGYLDCNYGDFFAPVEVVPKIYDAFVKVISEIEKEKQTERSV